MFQVLLNRLTQEVFHKSITIKTLWVTILIKLIYWGTLSYAQDFTKITSGDPFNDGGSSYSNTWTDYDQDGDLNLYFCNRNVGINKNNNLYQNTVNGQLNKVTDVHITQETGSLCAAWGDLDNDGFIDVLNVSPSEGTEDQETSKITKDTLDKDIDKQLLHKARDIADRILIIDCHNHNLFQPGTKTKPKQAAFSMLRESGINGIVQSFPLDFNTISNPAEDIIKDIMEVKKRIKNDSMKVKIALKSEDFISFPKDDSVAVMIGLEYFKGIFGGNVEMVEKYYREGVREIGLVRKTGMDSICINEALTRFGTDLIIELNTLGIICDITHMPESAQIKIIGASKSPVILSHTASFSLVNSRFNATDLTLQKLTEKGGIICVTFFSGQLSNKALNHLNSKKDFNQLPKAGIEDFVDQIDYLKEKVGIDYIGIGSDYGGSGRSAPKGLETIEGFPLIIYHLLKRGYDESEIEKIMGMNFIRFFEKVEKEAALN